MPSQAVGLYQLTFGCIFPAVRLDEVLAKVEICNRQMFADLQAQTEAGFASLKARIDALPLPLSERKNDEPPKLN
jgi:hypothetical protein